MVSTILDNSHSEELLEFPEIPGDIKEEPIECDYDFDLDEDIKESVLVLSRESKEYYSIIDVNCTNPAILSSIKSQLENKCMGRIGDQVDDENLCYGKYACYTKKANERAIRILIFRVKL